MTLIQILIGALLCAPGSTWAGVVDDLEPYQTHFFFDTDPNPRDEFRVFVERETDLWFVGDVNVGSAAEGAALSAAAVREVHAEFQGPLKLLPPEAFTRWPTHFDMVLAINSALRKLHPHALRVSAQFVRRYQRILVTEVIPFNKIGAKPRLGTRTRAEFRREESAMEAPYGVSSLVTNSELFPAGALTESTLRLDFKLPANLDGMPLIHAALREKSPPHRQALAALMGALASGRAIVPSAVPALKYEFSVDIYGRIEGRRNQHIDRVTFHFTNLELRDGAVDRMTVATNSQVSLRFSGGLETGLTLELRDAREKPVHTQLYDVHSTSNEVTLIPSPDPNVINRIRLKTQQRPYTDFDIYPQIVTACSARLKP